MKVAELGFALLQPYGDPHAPFQRKCAFDVGDYGLGFCANSLALGCDCLGHIKYFDAVLNDSKGKPLMPYIHLPLIPSLIAKFVLCPLAKQRLIHSLWESIASGVRLSFCEFFVLVAWK